MGKFNRKNIINYLIVWICLFFIGLGMSFNAKTGDIIIFSDEVCFTEENISYVNGYDIDNNIYIPNNNDPQIGFTNLNSQVASILINLSEPVSEDTFIQIYYAEVGDYLKEENSIRSYIYEGEEQYYMYLPIGIYSELRIDINGQFSLDSIIGSPQYAMYDKVVEWKDILCACFIATILTCIVFIFIQKRKNIYDIWKKEICEYTKTQWFIFGITITAFTIWSFFWGCSLLTENPLDRDWYVSLFIGMIIVILLVVFSLKNKISEKPEVVFLVICILISSYLVVTLPMGSVSWDDETHYKRALGVSNILDEKVAYSELKYTTPFIENVTNAQAVSVEKIELNDLYDKTSISIDTTLNLYNAICYIPSAFFMFVGRAIGIPAHSLFYMGRLGMVYMYVFLVYQAMKRLKSGKMILATIALIPTNLFLCASYSYDPWVTGFSMLGIACIVSELQQPEKKMPWKEVVIMLGSFLMVGSAKAIYFPLVALALFVGKNKFSTKKEYQRYITCVLGTMFAMILSFVLPMLISSGGNITDTRGGSDVNGMEQIKFILQNPIEYCQILFNFLKGYLSVEQSEGFMTFFAYIGYGVKFEVLLILLGIVAVTDKNEYDTKINYWYKWGSFGIAIITVILVATSMYITFTPVGSQTINGCQSRYLMPVMFLVLIVAGSKNITNHINKTYYNLSIYGVTLYIICSCFWEKCVMLYT